MRALLLDALRDVRRRGAGTLIAVTGLTIALSACLLVALFALALAAPDPEVRDPRRTIMLDFKGNIPNEPSPWFARSPVVFGPLLKARHAPMDLISRMAYGGMEFPVADRLNPALLLAVDPDIVDVLNLHALAGDLRATLSRPDTIAITTDLMHKLWGTVAPADAIGRRVLSHKRWYTVTAVLPDTDPRSPLYGASPLVGNAMAMANFDSPANEMPEGDRVGVFIMSGRVFARLRPGTSIDQVAGWMHDAFVTSPAFGKDVPPAWSDHREAAFFRGVAIADLPFAGPGNELRWTGLAALGAACALLLALSALNTLSLQAAHLLQRQRETALRSSLGAAAPHLLQLWTVEALLPIAASAGAALLLAWWIAPAVANWIGLPPELPLADPVPLAALAGLAVTVLALLPLVVALPAWRALRRVPATALQGRTASEGPWGRRVRQALLGVQLGGALLLLTLAGVLALQQRHMLGVDRGFKTHDRLTLSMETDPDHVPALDAFSAALSHSPAISHWSYSYLMPVSDVDNLGSRELERSADGHVVETRLSSVGASFFDTWGMTVLAGTPRFSEGDSNIVVDAKTARLLGFATPQAAIGALLTGGGGFLQQGSEPRRIVAVVKDVSLESARYPRMPQAFWLMGSPQWVVSATGPDPVALRSALDTAWKTYGLKVPYELQWADDQLADVYRQEAQMTTTVAVVSLMAVVVAMLGAYAMVADTLRRRRTELVLHRLHGAGDAAIARQVAAEFAGPLLGAVLVALPIAGWVGWIYLSGFQDRVTLVTGLVVPAFAAVGATLAVTALACLRHVRLALALRPIEALA